MEKFKRGNIVKFKMKQSKYIKLLIDNKHYPTQFSFGVSTWYDEENETSHEHVVYYEIGLNVSVDNNIKVISFASRSALIEVTVCGIKHEFRVYAPLTISPNEFYDRVSHAISSRFYGLHEGDEGFENFKEAYSKRKQEVANKLKTLKFKKVDIDDSNKLE